MSHQPRYHAFTLVEAGIILALMVFIAAIFLPLLGAPRGKGSRAMQNLTQLRGIQQSLIIYAQGNKGPNVQNGFYPGLNPDGTDHNLNVEFRLKELLDGNYLVPEYFINPAEDWKTIQPYDATVHAAFTANHYSYALLQIPAHGARRAEWSETINTQGPVAADRNTGNVANPQSVWTNPGDPWKGAIVFNDNHVAFESTHLLETEYENIAHKNDHLFDPAGDDDAYLIHSGN